MYSVCYGTQVGRRRENGEVAKNRSCIILQVFPKISKGNFIFSKFQSVLKPVRVLLLKVPTQHFKTSCYYWGVLKELDPFQTMAGRHVRSSSDGYQILEFLIQKWSWQNIFKLLWVFLKVDKMMEYWKPLFYCLG